MALPKPTDVYYCRVCKQRYVSKIQLSALPICSGKTRKHTPTNMTPVKKENES